MNKAVSTDLFTAWQRPKTLVRGFKVSILVGSVLLLINQGPQIYQGSYPALWQIFLTYLVPFLVSTISSALSEVHHAKTLDLS